MTTMENKYAKEYYDTHLKDLSEDYIQSRWFSSAPAKLDFAQTKRTIVSALAKLDFSTVLEIGPGDGVWTNLLMPKAKQLTLVDQSIEMLKRAEGRLKDIEGITYKNEDFLNFTETASYDLIFTIRCFEYFEDKYIAAKKFNELLKSGGSLVIVTKNPEHINMGKVQERELHRGQISKQQMLDLLSVHGFTVKQVLSTTWRMKAKFMPLRALFNGLHYLHVKTGGAFMVPFATNKLTESYIYVAHKQ